MERVRSPWAALWALVLGFFMILVDTTIVSVANPVIMEQLHADINSVIWVTSAYLLTYAVPLLITGRLGDRFGPKRIYLLGLAIFTIASAWCGFSDSIEMLIAARALQGFGAALLTPQSMTVITRIFPPQRRGAAMGVWGSVAGAAMLVGPVLGGMLVDGFGWEWIFFVNLPVGVVAFVLAVRLVPDLATQPHRFDIVGVVLSALGMTLLIFGIQEGETYNWGVIWGPISVWLLIVLGIVILVAFVVWQSLDRLGEPLLPLRLFKDRNFSLSNAAITLVGLGVTAMGLPFMFYLQLVGGIGPTQAALIMVPMAILSAVLAAPVGRLVDRVNPKWIAVIGLLLNAVALIWEAFLMRPDVDVLWFLWPSTIMGIASAAMWSPISSTVTRNLPRSEAGAGSGVYNATRQVGAVLGSALIALIMQARLNAELQGAGEGALQSANGALPVELHEGFAAAMAQSILMPAVVMVLAAIIVVLWEKPRVTVEWINPSAPEVHDGE